MQTEQPPLVLPPRPYPALRAVKALPLAGFSAKRLLARGEPQTMIFRRTWHGTDDVVFIFDEHDAEAYRANVTVRMETDPFALAERPDLAEEVTGTVVDVVATVLEWP